MKPASFHYLSPTNIQDALAMLGENGPDTRLLAGGQSLVPMMNFRLARPTVLIDLNRIPDLSYICDGGDHLSIGAMTRERTIENSDLVRDTTPVLHDATLQIGHLPIRSRGTIGGSIANADPAAEYPATMLALDATLIAKSLRGERRIDAADFFEGVLSTTLAPDEILTEIIVPKTPRTAGGAFVELSRRQGDFALAGVAAQIEFDGEAIINVRLAACGVGAAPVRLSKSESVILAHGLSENGLSTAERAARAEVDPDGDVHATADYRRKLAGVMTKRALLKAAERAPRTR